MVGFVAHLPQHHRRRNKNTDRTSAQVLAWYDLNAPKPVPSPALLAVDPVGQEMADLVSMVANSLHDISIKRPASKLSYVLSRAAETGIPTIATSMQTEWPIVGKSEIRELISFKEGGIECAIKGGHLVFCAPFSDEQTPKQAAAQVIQWVNQLAKNESQKARLYAELRTHNLNKRSPITMLGLST